MPLKKLFSFSLSLLLSISAVNAQSEEARNRAIDLYNNSVVLIKNGDFAAAENVLSQAVQVLPNDANILCNYGLALMKMGKLEEAKERLLRGTQVKPDYDLMWLNLGLVQEGLGDLVSAKASLQKFVALAPHNPYSEHIKAHIPEIDKLLATGVGPDSLNKPDYIDELSTDQKQRWSASRMPLKIYLKPGDGVQGYKPSYGQALENALDDWIKALEGKMSIVKVDDATKGDIVVKWTNDLTAGVNRSEGGDVRYSATAAGIDHADVTLLTLDPSPTVRLNDSLVYWISLHELGHGLGIVGHSRNPADIMFFSAPQKVNPQLSSRDVQTIRRLYSEQLENWMTLNDQGIRLMNEQKYDEALKKLDKALRLRPDKTVIKTNIITTEGNHALKLLNENKLANVEQHFARALALEQEVRDGNLPMLLNNYSVFLTRVARADEINDLYKHFGMKPPRGMTASGNAPWQKPVYNPAAPTGEPEPTNPGPEPGTDGDTSTGSSSTDSSNTPTTDADISPADTGMPPTAPAFSSTGSKPLAKPGVKPTAKAGAKPTVKAVIGKPSAKKMVPGLKPGAVRTPSAKPTSSSPAKPASTPATKPASTPAAKPASTPAAKPASTPAAKPASTNATKPASALPKITQPAAKKPTAPTAPRTTPKSIAPKNN